MKKYVLFLLCQGVFFLNLSPVQASVTGRHVVYRAGETVLMGFVAENTSVKGKRPAVLVVHEWWGQNAYSQKRAMMLAELGYVAFAVDMYGEGKNAQDPDNARALSREVLHNRHIQEERFNAALAFVRQLPLVDQARIAAIGYCFGGSVVLHMARTGTDLKGVVSFHGSLATDSPALPGEVKANVLVFHGEKDTLVLPEQVHNFLDEMALSGTPFRYIEYPGVKHGFTNSEADRYAKEFGLPLGYDKIADQNSWEELQNFLSVIFQK